MGDSTFERFLSTSPVARRTRAEARVVVRRFQASPREIDAALKSGTIEVDAQPACDLVVGDVLLARGEIVSENGTSHFVVKEVVE